ncbi:hypothetical protein [Nocardioides sp.]|uniref:hypothetical protein n=1 Tax=Nocardioides sp. TaxID=35761 RepID=UPI002B5C72B8|nr:hypothetical protein [Nocardioides sp.]HSX67550.1 hypothetical protein [Nocardioides sp.]
MTGIRASAARLAAGISFTLVTALGAVALSPSTAHAGVWADKCGTGYGLKTVLYGYESTHRQYGELRVFTKGTGAGTDWCAITVKKGPLYGKATWSYLKGEGTYRDGSGYVKDYDQGNFQYWAGPVRVANRPVFTVWSTLYSVSGSTTPAYSYLRFQEGRELSN